MRNIRLLDKRNWDFILYDVDGKKIFSVVFFGSLIDYSRNFKLESEIILNHEELISLAEKIRNNYNDYKDFEVPLSTTKESD